MNKSKNKDKVDYAIAKWQEQFSNVDVSAKEVVGRIIRLNCLMLDKISNVLKKFNLKQGEYAVLCTLRLHGPHHQLPVKKIIEVLLLSSGGLSNLLDRMEAKDLISRSLDPTDRRGVLVKLTVKSKKIIDSAMNAHADIENSLLEGMSVNEQGQLAMHLRKLLCSLETNT